MTNSLHMGPDRRGGAALLLVLVVSISLGLLITVLLERGQVDARSARFDLSSLSALNAAYGELEKAKLLIRQADYDADGNNHAIEKALGRSDRRIKGTLVDVGLLPDAPDGWYRLNARVPYEEDYVRVVSLPMRELDYFSSYLLFVSEDSAGISGTPEGAIHSNRSVQFYFPNGSYRNSVTAVEGIEYIAGATEANTTLEGAFNPAAERIELDLEREDSSNLGYIAANSEEGFRYPEDIDVKLELHVIGDEQWVRTERWSQPRTELVEREVVIGVDRVNEREETYAYTERVNVGSETRTREEDVVDHYETITEEQDVPVFRTETRTRTVMREVWVEGESGGTTIGGDGAAGPTRYLVMQEVEEEYTVEVIDHYETRTVTYDIPIYRTETVEYEHQLYENVSRTGTRTVWDEVPVTETRTVEEHIAPYRISVESNPAPENGLIHASGNIKAVQGETLGRLTIASEGSITIGGNLVYKDVEGDTAYLNGNDPGLPYEPNPDYQNDASLGLLARKDVLYSRDVPDNLEINAAMAAMTGRVGIEGVVLGENGVIEDSNDLRNAFDEPVSGIFRKNSIRRLGGITTARRPVETVLEAGAVVSGFNVGQAVYDRGLLISPPPSFLSFHEPRFFPMEISR